MLDEDGIGFGIAHAGLVVWPAAPWRIGMALSAWAIWTGFFESTLGLLTFSGPDLIRLGALGLLAAVGTHLVPRRWDRLGP
jgi:hypothetical protein